MTTEATMHWTIKIQLLLYLANQPLLNSRILNIFEKMMNNLEAKIWKVKIIGGI